MGLARRIIPCLDVDNGRVVKGVNFVDIRDAGDPVEIAARYNEQGADEITFLDITASHEGRETTVHTVEAIAREVFIPLTVGGGIRSVEDIRTMLNAGADKVSINTAAIHEPELVRRASGAFRCAVHRGGHRCQARRRHRGERRGRAGRSSPTAGAAHGHRRRGLGAAHGGARCRRNPPHQHGPRRYPRRLRARCHPGHHRRRGYPGDRLRRCRQPAASRRRRARRAVPTRCSPPASFTSASTRSPRPRRTWPPRASRCAASDPWCRGGSR
jgi:hypothetical protein